MSYSQTRENPRKLLQELQPKGSDYDYGYWSCWVCLFLMFEYCTDSRSRLNLATANRVFLVEPQWNPSVENQAIARALRLGQEQAVIVTRYVVDETVELVGSQIIIGFLLS
jgi:hypothetical protein